MLTNPSGDRQRSSAALQKQLDRFRRNCQRQDRQRCDEIVSHACAIVIVHGVTAGTFGRMSITAHVEPVAISMTSANGRVEG